MDMRVFDKSFMESFLKELREVFGEKADYDYILDDIGSNGFEAAFAKAARECGPRTLAVWQEAQKLDWDASDTFEARLVERFRAFGLLR